jgi:hypothetical protein
MNKLNIPQPTGKVVIAQDIQKISEHIDIYGNVINPKTKEIIKKAEDNEEEK